MRRRPLSNMVRFRIVVEIDMPADTSRDVFNEVVKEMAELHLPIGGDVCYLATEIVDKQTYLK